MPALRRIFLLALFALTANLASAQIKAVEKFVAGNKNLTKYFIYQSTLRMLNQQNDPDFNKLIKDIRKINAYVAEENSGISQAGYQKMLTDLANERFETLVSVKEDGALINLLSRESGDSAYYVLAASQGSSFALLEMDGNLDLRYLQALDGINFTNLEKILTQSEKSSHQ